MVYKILDSGIKGESSKVYETVTRSKSQAAKSRGERPTSPPILSVLVKLIRCVLFICDMICLPVYYWIQRPDVRLRACRLEQSRRIDWDTWAQIDTTDPPEDDKSKSWTLDAIFSNAVQEFSQRPALGYRAVVSCPVVVPSEQEGGPPTTRSMSFRSDFTWYTFEQIGRRVHDIASGLYYFGLYPGQRVFFMASTCLEWFCAAQACYQVNAQLVVAPEVDDVKVLRSILRDCQAKIIFTSTEMLDKLCALFESEKTDNEGDSERAKFQVRKVVLIDWLFSINLNDSDFAMLRESGENLLDQVLSMSQIEELGAENPIQVSCSKSLNIDPSTFASNTCKNQHQHSINSHCNSIDDLADSRGVAAATAAHRERRRSSTAATATLRLRKISNNSTSYKAITVLTDPDSFLELSANSRAKSIPKLASSSSSTSNGFRRRDPKSGPRDTRRIEPKPDQVAMIVYTYGLFGQIKPLILTHNHLARGKGRFFLDGLLSGRDVHCATQPLDSTIEFMTEVSIFGQGGSIGYSCSPNTLFYDGKALFDKDKSDIQALEPTFLSVKPYKLEQLRTSIQDYMLRHMWPLQSYFITHIVYDYKKYWSKSGFRTPILDRLFCSTLKNLFGSRLEYILCNGTTDCSETKDFFNYVVNVPVIELYGPDEAIASLISVNRICDHRNKVVSTTRPVRHRAPPVEDSFKNLLVNSSILRPALGAKIRLVDWEDFKTSDRPNPRGRLLIGGDIVCQGYHNRPDLSNEWFFTDHQDKTSWFRTNDIARVFLNGSLEIISGISDLVRMADGQLISLTQIEHVLRNSQLIDNVCVICGENKALIIALVVPNIRRLALKSPGEDNLKMAIGMDPEPDELTDIEFRREVCNDRLLCEFLSKHLTELINGSGIKGLTSRFHLVPEIWTPKTELVNSSFEPKRAAIQRYYATDINSVFKMESTPPRQRLSARVKRKRVSSPAVSHRGGFDRTRLSA